MALGHLYRDQNELIDEKNDIKISQDCTFNHEKTIRIWYIWGWEKGDKVLLISVK